MISHAAYVGFHVVPNTHIVLSLGNFSATLSRKAVTILPGMLTQHMLRFLFRLVCLFSFFCVSFFCSMNIPDSIFRSLLQLLGSLFSLSAAYATIGVLLQSEIWARNFSMFNVSGFTSIKFYLILFPVCPATPVFP